MRRLTVFLSPILLVATAGCVTPAPVMTKNVDDLRGGLVLANNQTQAAFAGTNILARRFAVERRLDNPSGGLSQDDFPVALKAEDLRRWREAFAVLDTYLGALQRLVDEKHSAGVRDEIGAVATAMQDSGLGIKLPKGVGEAVAVLGGALVQVRAERRAQRVMQQVDPAFGSVMTTMARAIGTDELSGVRGTTRILWDAELARQGDLFRTISAGKRDARRVVVRDYLAARDARAADNANLAAVGDSLRAIAAAHRAAAYGRTADAHFWIERVSGWAGEVRSRIEAAAASKE